MRTTAFTEIKVKQHLLTSIFMIHFKVERFLVLSSDYRRKKENTKGRIVINLRLKDSIETKHRINLLTSSIYTLSLLGHNVSM